MRQIEVINLETIIDVTAETSNVEILVQDYDAELVERFALEAQEAAIDAEESADIATAQASIATAQATIATTQAGIATTQAGIATTQAGIATTKANEASASAASALASEQAADADRIAAQAAASTATTQAGIATTQAGIATTKAGEASASAASALASENSASSSASTATTQAGIATTQAGIATTQAGIATTQAGNALTSANNAAASAAAAAQVGTSTLLTGLPALTNTAITATDSILQAFAEAQGQINARVSGTGASGQVAFWNGTSSQTADSNFLWNNTNKILRVGTLLNFGGGQLSFNRDPVSGAVTDPTLGTATILGGQPVGSGIIQFFVSSGAGNTGLAERMRLLGTGNLLINTTTDSGFRLDVNGTARVQGALTATADAVVNGVNIGRGGGNLDSNTVIGLSAGINNTTGVGNFSGGLFAGQNNTTGSGNIFLGSTAGRLTASGANMTISNNSIFLGSNSRPNAINETNQIVIGQNAIGLGSNTTVLGNTSTTHGRWYGSLLLGTTTNAASSILTMESTTQGFLPPRMTSAQRNLIGTPATGLVVYNTTDNRLSVFNGTSWVNLATI
jgi:hypothetical protein